MHQSKQPLDRIAERIALLQEKYALHHGRDVRNLTAPVDDHGGVKLNPMNQHPSG
jgi:hypothetical protein